MRILPAVDIKSGKCVRLWQGSFNRVDVYGDDPVQMALRWEQEGAQMLHIVDLDAAVSGNPVNRDCITDILHAVHVPVQVGGGIRSSVIAEEYIRNGARSVVITTFAYERPAEVTELAHTFPGKISIGVDVISGAVAIRGWTQTSTIRPYEFIKQFSTAPIHAFIMTDIYKDGTLSGLDITRIEEALEGIHEPVIISGGVSTLDDIKKLRKIKSRNIIGVIVGRALYTGNIILRDALKETD